MLELLHNIATQGRKLLLRTSSDFSGLLLGGERQSEAALHTAVFCRRWPVAGLQLYLGFDLLKLGYTDPVELLVSLGFIPAVQPTQPLYSTTLLAAEQPGLEESGAELSFLPSFLEPLQCSWAQNSPGNSCCDTECWAGGSAPLILSATWPHCECLETTQQTQPSR